MQDKTRQTSNLVNIVQYDDSGSVTLPALLTLGQAPSAADNSAKAPSTAWVRTLLLGYASLDEAGKVPASQLPSYVDDVVEYANFASLPVTGETGKIYVTIDNSKSYRWAGSSYVEISASPGSTDAVPEGSVNLYFTTTRARNSISVAGSLSYDSGTGVISYTTPNTDAITEGLSNLYFTDARARAAVSAAGTGLSYNSLTGVFTWTNPGYITLAESRAGLSLTTTGSSGASTYNSTTGALNIPQYTLAGLGGEPAITAGTTAQYWRGDKSWQTLNTSAVAESGNLYFTTDRARSSVSAAGTGLTYNSTTGVFTWTNPGYITSYTETDTLASVTARGASTTAQITVDSVISNNNGNGTNFRIGDDAWIGDVNAANTFRVQGVQNAANGYIIFGNADGSALGRAGSGALTYAGNTVWHSGNLSVGNGTLSMGVSGNGLSGSTSFTANQSGNATFTVASNATSSNAGSTIVFRDGSGNFSAGSITIAGISGAAQTIANNYGAYLHIGGWAIGRTDPTAVLVNTAYRADYATDLFDMNISRFTNNSGYITSAGRAYPRRSDGTSIDFYYSGQSGQPTWLWGTNDGVSMYVWNPSNFSVSYATSAGSATNATNATNGRYVYNNGAYGGTVGYIEASAVYVVYANSAGSASSATNAGYATSAGNADTVDSQHFTYSNSDNNPTYLWGTNSNGSSFLAARGSMSVNYANSAGSASSATNATNATNATYATYGRYVYDDGAYGGSVGYKEASSLMVYYSYLSRLVYNNGAYGGTVGYIEPSAVPVVYANSAGSAGNADTVDGYHMNQNVLTTSDVTFNTVYASGNITAYSDSRLKENVITIDNALDKVIKLRGVYFNRISDETKTRKLGVIAQEVREVLPEVVIEKEGTLSVDYGNIVGVLIEAIKDQQKQIEELKARLN